MGRPKGTERGRRTQLALYVTGEEREAFARRSAAVGMTTGEWARLVLRRDAGMWTGGEIMTLTTDQIIEALESLGETGSAKVERGGLYTRREENADWLFRGAVEDEAEASETVRCYFER